MRVEARSELAGGLVEPEEELPQPVAVDEGPNRGERGEQGKHFSVVSDVEWKVQMGLRAEVQAEPVPDHEGTHRV